MDGYSLVDAHASGNAAELFVAATLIEQGWAVYWPMLTQSRCDLVGEKDGKFFKIQVKRATQSKTGEFKYLQARLKSRNKYGKSYTKEEVDYFAFVFEGQIWLAPFEDLAGYTSVCLGSTNPDYKKQTKYEAETWRVKH